MKNGFQQAFATLTSPGWSPWRRLMLNGLLLQVLASLSPGHWVSTAPATIVFVDTALFCASLTMLLAALLFARVRLFRRPARHRSHAAALAATMLRPRR